MQIVVLRRLATSEGRVEPPLIFGGLLEPLGPSSNRLTGPSKLQQPATGPWPEVLGLRVRWKWQRTHSLGHRFATDLGDTFRAATVALNRNICNAIQ